MSDSFAYLSPCNNSWYARAYPRVNKNQYTHNLRTNSDKYIKRLSTKILTDHETALFAKDLKFIPTPPKQASQKNLLKDFEAFTRYMRLQYIFANSKSKPHPFHVRSTWQPPPKPSVALESYLERTKYEIANLLLSPQVVITYQQNKERH